MVKRRKKLKGAVYMYLYGASRRRIQEKSGVSWRRLKKYLKATNRYYG
jgi:hypothetical protein